MVSVAVLEKGARVGWQCCGTRGMCDITGVGNTSPGSSVALSAGGLELH